MAAYQTSIQNKVKFAYYVCIGVIIVVALLKYYDLKTLNDKITFNLIISEFFDTTLEMRRYEKNYFLYKDDADYMENLRFTEMADGLIKRNKEGIRRLSPQTDISTLESDLVEYKSLMRKYYNQNTLRDPGDTSVIENRIREKGKKLVSFTEDISLKERKYILTLIATSKNVLVASVFVLIVAGYLIGQYLSKMVVRPLKQLEEGMQRIAEGKFDTLSTDYSAESEIISLDNAFSRMIKELELRQVRLMSQSEKLVALGTMVSGVAHELNNPLSNISSSCQILTEEIEEADVAFKRELLQQIDSEVDRAKATVNCLLEFSRKRQFKSGPVLLSQIVNDTIRLVQGDIPTHVDITVDIPGEFWIVVDKQRVQQAILNIVKNAIDALQGDGTITISAGEDPAGGIVEIKIADTGPGIDPENMARIFEPFFTTKDDGKGSGLGLFVTREIIAEHGGTIDVTSGVGEGTTFIIQLPAKEHHGIQG